MRKSIAALTAFAAMAAMAAQSNNPSLNETTPYTLTDYGSGSGAGQFHWYTSPIFIPYKHIKQTYRSQQRAAKQRRKQR